jgi:hypothetical protein
MLHRFNTAQQTDRICNTAGGGRFGGKLVQNSRVKNTLPPPSLTAEAEGPTRVKNPVPISPSLKVGINDEQIRLEIA